MLESNEGHPFLVVVSPPPCRPARSLLSPETALEHILQACPGKGSILLASKLVPSPLTHSYHGPDSTSTDSTSPLAPEDRLYLTPPVHTPNGDTDAHAYTCVHALSCPNTHAKHHARKHTHTRRERPHLSPKDSLAIVRPLAYHVHPPARLNERLAPMEAM